MKEPIDTVWSDSNKPDPPYIINVLNDTGYGLEKAWEMKDGTISEYMPSFYKEQLLTVLDHFIQHKLDIFFFQKQFAWLHIQLMGVIGSGLDVSYTLIHLKEHHIMWTLTAAKYP